MPDDPHGRPSRVGRSPGGGVVVRVAVIALLAACSSPAAPETTGTATSAVTHGASDATHTSVVALLQENQILCSGTLIAPRVVLTAAHCVATSSGSTLPDISQSRAPDSGGARMTTTGLWIHPTFDPVTHANDVAVLLTSAPLSGAPVPLGHALPASVRGASVTVVGFGKTSASAGGTPSRHDGTSTVSTFDASTLTLHPGPSLPCEGDSGGAVLIDEDGVTTVAGVISYGDPSCASYAVAARVDAYAADFLDAFASEGGVATGDRCFFDGNCASGGCVANPDAPRLSYCDAACASDAACPEAMTCVASRCRYSEPSPGAFGQPCTADLDCSSALCGARSASASTVCTTPCFVDAPSGSDGCGAGATCEPNAAVPGAAACFTTATATHGCASSPDAPAPAGSLEILASMAFLLQQRRRGTTSVGRSRNS